MRICSSFDAALLQVNWRSYLLRTFWFLLHFTDRDLLSRLLLNYGWTVSTVPALFCGSRTYDNFLFCLFWPETLGSILQPTTYAFFWKLASPCWQWALLRISERRHLCVPTTCRLFGFLRYCRFASTYRFVLFVLVVFLPFSRVSRFVVHRVYLSFHGVIRIGGDLSALLPVYS